MNQRFISTILVLAISFFVTSNIIGQTDQARITGTVTDASGAIVPGATVTVKNEKTGDTRTVNVTNDGTFSIVALQPSTYTVTATGKDFEPAKQGNIQLLVGQELKLALLLQPKGVSAQVDVVSGEEIPLNISSASMSVNVSPREVAGLPNSGRQLSQFYLQAP
ncbi:MAG TPA: carboxypeptidase-like regulatory domain-containing protein, partial [Pyrinomonadaceae bacterium]|nr:carboxypeptidase-like regulatory domain-containing protein [Pyrinomonadaceae bacterium]